MGLAHIRFNLCQDALLRRRERKRKEIPELLRVPVVDGEGDAFFQQRAAATQSQSQFQKEELVEDQPAMGRGFALVEQSDVFFRVGEVRPPQGLGQGDELLPLADLIRDAAEGLSGELIHDVLQDAAEQALALVKPFGLRVDGHDALEIQRIVRSRLAGSRFSLGVRCLVFEDLQLGVVDFFLELEEPDLSGENQPHALAEPSLHVPGIEVEPFRQQGSGFVPHEHFEGATPAVKSHIGGQDRSDDRLHLAHRELGDGLYLPPVLIEPGGESRGRPPQSGCFFSSGFRRGGAPPL